MKARKFERSIGDARGFTLIEMLVVIAIICALGGITVIGYNAVARDVRFRKAMGECAMLISACKTYRSLVNVWPDEASHAAILAILASPIDTGQLGRPPVLDTLKQSQVDGSGTMIDPWGSPYVIEFPEEGILVYSFGPDQESDEGHYDGDGCPDGAHASFTPPVDDVKP